MYLCQDERPSFMAFQRFISNQIKGNASDIFTEIMLVICKKMKVNTRILYIDGTSMEANANKFSFVWKKTAVKTKRQDTGKNSRYDWRTYKTNRYLLYRKL